MEDGERSARRFKRLGKLHEDSKGERRLKRMQHIKLFDSIQLLTLSYK
ncbi:MAG: hypothetical protein PWP38_1389 [Clostridiales bacterium]|nr:hypothetical protein [Clostridiales bacterium]